MLLPASARPGPLRCEHTRIQMMTEAELDDPIAEAAAVDAPPSALATRRRRAPCSKAAYDMLVRYPTTLWEDKRRIEAFAEAHPRDEDEAAAGAEAVAEDEIETPSARGRAAVMMRVQEKTTLLAAARHILDELSDDCRTKYARRGTQRRRRSCASTRASGRAFDAGGRARGGVRTTTRGRWERDGPSRTVGCQGMTRDAGTASAPWTATSCDVDASSARTRRASKRGPCWYSSNRRVTLFTRVILYHGYSWRGSFAPGRARALGGRDAEGQVCIGAVVEARGSAALRAASDSDDSDNSATRPDVVELEERGGDDDISENHADDPAGDEDGRGDVPSVPPAVGGESWRSQRSRAVMRQLKSLSRQSSRSLSSPTWSARGAFVPRHPPRRRGQRALGRSRDRLWRGRGRHAPHRFRNPPRMNPRRTSTSSRTSSRRGCSAPACTPSTSGS